jgi:hypothetical protein
MSGLPRNPSPNFLGTEAHLSFPNTKTGNCCQVFSTAFRLAAVYDRPITDLYPDLYRQIQEEVQIAKGKKHSVIK